MRLAYRLLPLFFISAHTFAIDDPLRDPKGLRRPKEEEVVRVKTAKVVIADYALLKRDFPEISTFSHPQIDLWLLAKAGYVAAAQANQTNVNSSILTLPVAPPVSAYRPQDYGRALVFKTNGGLIDAKGVGSESPSQWDHGNGLATLGEMIREYAFEKLVSQIFRHSGSHYKTVGSYAVIDWGFDVVHPDKSTSAAGAILRQAHIRNEGTYSLFNEKESLTIETILRRYGVTSAGAYHDGTYEKINIQGTSTNGVLDFGGFLVLKHFEKPATHFYGAKVLIDPNSGTMVQPDDAIRVPFELWGHTVSGKDDPKYDNPWIWSHELARNLRNGKATPASVSKHLETLLEPVSRRLDPNCNSALAKISTR